MSTTKKSPEERALQRQRYARELQRLACSPDGRATYTAHSSVDFVKALRRFLDLPPFREDREQEGTGVERERARTITYRTLREGWILVAGGEMRAKLQHGGE